MAESRSTLQRIVKHATFVRHLITDRENKNSTSAKLAKGRVIIGMLTMMLALLQIITGRSVGSDISPDIKTPITYNDCTTSSSSFADDCCIPEFGWDSWNGMIVFITGLLGIFCHQSRPKLITFLVTAIVAATTSAFFTMWLAIDLLTNKYSPSMTDFFLLAVLFVEMVCCSVGASFACGPICYPRQIDLSQQNRDSGRQGSTNDRSLSFDSTSHMECSHDYGFRKQQYSLRVYSEIEH